MKFLISFTSMAHGSGNDKFSTPAIPPLSAGSIGKPRHSAVTGYLFSMPQEGLIGYKMSAVERGDNMSYCRHVSVT